MKKTFIVILTISTFASCDFHLHITGNPDKSTTNSGTAGSARMSTELPGKPGTAGLGIDTNKIGGPIVIGYPRAKKDSLPR